MRGAFVFAVAAALILLFGCASEPKPSEGVQGIVVQSAGGLLDEVQAPKAEPAAPGQEAGQEVNCTLVVKQAAIVAGEQADIALNARFSGSAQFDLACGNDTRRLLSENTLALETRCKFDSPGTQSITVKANGRTCANASIDVRKKAGGVCSIDGASIVRDLSAYSYSWTVYFDGFSDGDMLTWVCGNTVAKKRLSSDPIWGMPRFESLSCDFPGRPAVDYMNVSISGVPCGTVPTR